jgi:hypothetical protein
LQVTNIVFAGLIGTVLMSISMGVIHRTGIANADMIRALGSLVTRSLQRAFPVGLLIHLTAGVLFAFPYTYILRSLPVTGAAAELVVGAAIGAFHGAAMSFVLLAVVAEKHPLEQFRDSGIEVGAAHVVGHVFYGAGLGLAWALLS